MTPEQRQRMTELCEKIQVETDRKEFTKLVYEINVLFEEHQESLDHDPKSSTQF